MKEYQNINQALEGIFGEPKEIVKQTSVSGGDINRAYRLELSGGERVFMKANSRANIGFFRAEVRGLAAIRETKAVDAPEVLAIGTTQSSSFLILNYIEEGRRNEKSLADLGRKLAGMHHFDAGQFSGNGMFGFLQDNYIGAGPQINTPKNSWIEFFRECRLQPQIQRASAYFDKKDRKKIDAFLGKLDHYLSEPEKPSLLHGDLWGGNVMIDSSGTPWLIDPAAYVGHPEADLAMTELFGGFGGAFYDAYREAAGIDRGYKDRRDIYNLYHLLNHLNLFGGSYLYSVRAIIDRFA